MSERLLAVLLQQALLLSVGVVLVATLRPLLLKRLGAGSVYAAWLIVPALLATPALPRPAQEPLRVVLQASGTAETVAVPSLPAPPPDRAVVWLALWLAGSALVAATQARRQRRLARLGAQLPAGSSPALVGLLRPRVALPADFEQRFSPTERELILAHEQVHRDRLDNLWNLLACVLTALHWWNPLAWWAACRLRADQELACDAAVLAARPGALADYTRALLAAHDLTHHGAPLASRWGTTHPLVERIAMLNRPRPLNRRRALLLAAGVTAVSTLAYAAESPPPAAAGAGYIEMQLKVERSQGSSKSTIEARVVGRDGERVTVLLKGIGLPGDEPDWTKEPLSITLWPKKAGDSAAIRTQISHGEPAIELGHPGFMSAWGQKARIEITRPDSDEKFALELTPTALPADFQPPKNTF
ncbi:M56 family metallopeptidase [Roseateles sp. BYS78W]|uniref:M56 family metallopeptidase n=1 Tax=Pelomonas candidula TaxID=3299025 RepID=A0ABW7HBU2_9BURK